MAFLIGASEQSILPVTAVRDGIVFPNTENVLVFGRPKSVNAINAALKKDKKIVLVMQKNSSQDDPNKEELYSVGVLATIEKTVVGEKGEINALLKGKEKVRIVSYVNDKDFYEAKIEVLKDVSVDDEEIQAMVKHISAQIKKAINFGKTVDFVFLMNILNLTNPQDFSYQIAVVIDLKPEDRQGLLEEADLKNRLKKEVEYVNREIKILEIEFNISSKTQKKFEQGMKETFLREKMKTIEEELGEKEDKDLGEYQAKIKKAKMPKEVEDKSLKELKRLTQMSQFNPESSYIRTYLDWLVELPWSSFSSNDINIKIAQKILDEDHYGLKKIKERIIEYLAVMELMKRKKNSNIKEKQPTILCFVGPPGVGKTSLGKSIARALGRKFVKISLGGIRDEAEIRGHRRTYVG
ncbi:MAG: LON peptidase substrate-binding domain-containing protein, partial [bacterium]|nr:LON peptidase substrate-binding domain-containing protein [bacterium]